MAQVINDKEYLNNRSRSSKEAKTSYANVKQN